MFFNFKVVGKKVIIPYWMNKFEKEINGPYGGKGTPTEILEATLKAAKEQNMNLDKMSRVAINLFMKKNRIGLDCSGFAYQVLDFLDHDRGGDGLENTIVSVNGQGIRKVNADALTNNTNSTPLDDFSEIQEGDTIRLNGGKHIAFVVSAKDNEIIYAHISAMTKIEGPHMAKIKIIDSEKGLEEQEWEELAKDGTNYGELYFRPNLGDGLRRLKIWA